MCKKELDTLIIKVQNTEIEILDEIHRVCKMKHLRYSLFYGSLIGAVRHTGFIPWDDDIDIIMPREDYNKLINMWDDTADNDFVLQTYSTDSDYTNNFAKIRKNHTTYIQNENEKKVDYHTGIFVDIFPADRATVGVISKKIQFISQAINLLFSRGYSSGNKGWKHVVEIVLLRLPRKIQIHLRELSEKIMTSWNGKKGLPYVCACTIEDCLLYFPADMFISLKKIKFNGKYYYSVIDTDTVLRVNYGDYMQLPPEEERTWKHHPLVIDFDHNYDEIICDLN